MAVGALVDAPAAMLLQGLDAVRDTPAPLGQVPARLGVLARAASELQGVYLRALDRADRDGEHHTAGCRSTADLLVDTAGLPVAQARADTALARRLGQVPGLLDALAGGGLELPAARLVARAFAALPPRLRDAATAAALISLAGLVDLADLKGKVDELCAALAPDVTDTDLADARETGELTLVDVGAQTQLGGHTDALTGEWLREVLAAKAEADRSQHDGTTDPRTNAQRLLDALLDLVRAAVAHGAVPLTDDAPPTLVVVTSPHDLLATTDPTAADVAPEDALADLFTDLPDDLPGDLPGPADEAPDEATDIGSGTDSDEVTDTGFGTDTDGATDSDTNGAAATEAGTAGGPGADLPAGAPRRHTAGQDDPRWSTRSRGGVRLGPRSLAALACTAKLTRLLTDPAGWPLDSSPEARQLSRRERRALEHRAGYRCERLGCGRPAAVCVAHHVVPWALGGLSTLANTVLLCRSCHHLLHDRDRPLELTHDRRIGPRGWLRGNNDPPGTAPP